MTMGDQSSRWTPAPPGAFPLTPANSSTVTPGSPFQSVAEGSTVSRLDPPLDGRPVISPDCSARLLSHVLPKRVLNSEWWDPSYILDYLILLVSFACVGVLFLWIDAENRVYFEAPQDKDGKPVWADNQSTLAYKADEIVPNSLSGAGSIGVPVVVFLVYSIVKRSLHEFHSALMGLFSGMAFGYITQVSITRMTGFWRPDYWERLKGGDEHLIEQGIWSFPSGHSFLGFYCFGYLCFWIAGKLGAGHPGKGALWRSVFGLSFISLGFLQAVSRVMDNRHSVADITAGAAIGAVYSRVAYRLFYPPLWSHSGGRPNNRKNPLVPRVSGLGLQSAATPLISHTTGTGGGGSSQGPAPPPPTLPQP